jgi:tyrosine decarboxylase / aspartate 1-decarboxylase
VFYLCSIICYLYLDSAENIAIKENFMKFESKSLELLTEALKRMEKGFTGLPDTDINYDYEGMRKIILRAADKLQEDYPYFHPYYIGHMIKPPHPMARLGYMLALWMNPNNHSFDSSHASSPMEREAVNELARMFGWERALGHLCGGGTMANLEALWVSGKLNPGKLIVASEMAHYTHSRISEVLKLKFKSITCNERAQMDLNILEKLLKKGKVGTVVATIGTTGSGSVDSLPDILKLKDKYGFRLHIDSAYGGYFILVDNLSLETQKSFDLISQADSIVVDPHKHGLQPYGCGCVIFKNPDVGQFYKHDSPYTYFRSEDMHLGEITLECSRPGAAAVALWTTQKLLPMVKGGEFAGNLAKTRSAAVELFSRLSKESRFKTIFAPELDIVIWTLKGDKTSQISERTEEFLERAAVNQLYPAKFKYPTKYLKKVWKGIEFDSENVTCLRSCLDKPEHLDWMDEIWKLVDKTADEVLKA